MVQHQCSILYILCSANYILVSIKNPVYVVLTGSLNILFRVFPCILLIFFISYLLCIPVLIFHISVLVWKKLQKVLIRLLFLNSPPFRLDYLILKSLFPCLLSLVGSSNVVCFHLFWYFFFLSFACLYYLKLGFV